MTAAEPPPGTDFAALRAVPDAIERWWLAQATEALGAASPAETLERLRPIVRALSDSFTSERPVRYADYATDAPRRAAYGLYFGPQSWVRTRLVLAEAVRLRGWDPRGREPLRILDVGAGSGAAGLSVATWLRAVHGVRSVELVALDHSREALYSLERQVKEALPAEVAPHLTRVRGDATDPATWPPAVEGSFDLIVASFVLNEALPEALPESMALWLRRASERLSPGGLLLVLEPATKDAAGRLLEATALAVEAGLCAWGPQLGPGPWRPAPDRRTWPHEVRRWQVPTTLEHINRTLWRSLGELTWSHAILGLAPPAPLPPVGERLRLASPVRRTRGRVTGLGFTAAGTLLEWEAQTRDLSKDEHERLLLLERGDVVDLEGLVILDEGRRVRLPTASAVRRHLSPEGVTDGLA